MLIRYHNLSSTGSNEAAINRAYYAVINTTRALLISKDTFAKTHNGLERKLGELFIKTEIFPIDIGKIFSDLENLRKIADYEIDSSISDEAVNYAIDKAKIFVQTVIVYFQQEN